MDCPLCENESELGCILGDRYHLRWLPESRNVLSKVWAQGGIQVSEPRGPLGLGRPALMMHYCASCQLLFTTVAQGVSKQTKIRDGKRNESKTNQLEDQM